MKPSRILGAAILAAACTIAARPAEAQTGNLVLNSINLTGVTYNAVTRVLTATGGTVTGLLGGIPFTTNISNFVLSPGHGKQCAILDLSLAPIDISLLGLHIDTSPICLDITATQGQGILGDLLCSLAGAGGVLDTINSILNSADFLSSLSTVLNQALGHAKTAHGHAAGMVCTGVCQVLDVVIGPLNLNLLGVKVKLDDCAKGPVEVCVSATPSEGLLGELLCDLAGGGLSLQDLLNFIQDLVAGLGL
jgi:hypothetical protein